MGAEMQRTAGYHAQQSSDLYITDGDWNDWMYGALHRYPITIELSGGTFYPPDEIIPRESTRNHQAAIFVAAESRTARRGSPSGLREFKVARPRPHSGQRRAGNRGPPFGLGKPDRELPLARPAPRAPEVGVEAERNEEPSAKPGHDIQDR